MVSVRKNFLAFRDDLSPSQQSESSCEIIRKLVSLDEVTKSRIVFTYVSFRSEVHTHHLVQALFCQGKQVAVPVTVVAERRLLPVIIHDLNELSPGYCSILEPHPEIRASRLIPATDIDLIVLPGSVFDSRGGRMGYGGGYYDRFIANEAPKAYRIGLAYDFQVVDKLTLQSHDELMDLIVTEKRIIYGERRT